MFQGCKAWTNFIFEGYPMAWLRFMVNQDLYKPNEGSIARVWSLGWLEEVWEFFKRDSPSKLDLGNEWDILSDPPSFVGCLRMRLGLRWLERTSTWSEELGTLQMNTMPWVCGLLKCQCIWDYVYGMHAYGLRLKNVIWGMANLRVWQGPKGGWGWIMCWTLFTSCYSLVII